MIQVRYIIYNSQYLSITIHGTRMSVMVHGMLYAAMTQIGHYEVGVQQVGRGEPTESREFDPKVELKRTTRNINGHGLSHINNIQPTFLGDGPVILLQVIF